MNDYTEYPELMWMLTAAALGPAILAAAIPLVAGLTPPKPRERDI